MVVCFYLSSYANVRNSTGIYILSLGNSGILVFTDLFAMGFTVWKNFIVLFCQIALPVSLRYASVSSYPLNEKDDLQSQEAL